MKNIGTPAYWQLSPAQRGITLVELMVGIAIGLLVVVAAVGTLVTTQVTSTAVGDSARLQQKADFVFRAVGFQLRQAGGLDVVAPSPGSDLVAYSTSFTGYGGVTSPNLIVTGVEGGVSPDTLRVSYEEQVGVSRDCLGALPVGTVPGNRRVDSQFSVVGTELVCLGNGAAAPQTIADGVEDFQVTYGVRTVITPSPGISAPVVRVPDIANYRFFNADTAPFGTAVTFNAVNAVTICLRLRSDLKDTARQAIGVQGCDGAAIAGDGYIRRVYRSTFLLRSTVL